MIACRKCALGPSDPCGAESARSINSLIVSPGQVLARRRNERGPMLEVSSLQQAFDTAMRIFATVLLIGCALCIAHVLRGLLRAVCYEGTLKASRPEPQAWRATVRLPSATRPHRVAQHLARPGCPEPL